MIASAFRNSLQRELTHLARDRWDRALLIWLPLLSVLIVAAVFSAGQINDLPIGLVDADNSVLSRQLARLIDAAPGVRIVATPADHLAAVEAMRARTLYGVVEIPDGLEGAVKRGRQADVLFFYNAQFATAAGIVARDVQAATLTFAAGIRLVAREKRGENPLVVRESLQPIGLRLVSLFNESIDYQVFLGSALVPSILQIFMMLIGASAVGRELRDRTMTDWLNSDERALSTFAAALAGKLLPSFVVFSAWGLGYLAAWSAVQGGLALVSLLLLALGMLAMVAGYLLLGALTAAATSNLRTALSIVGFYTAPAFAYAGQAFPLLAMPLMAKIWASILPLTWWLQLQSQQWQMAVSPSISCEPLAVLLLFFVIGAPGAVLALKRVADQPERWGAR